MTAEPGGEARASGGDTLSAGDADRHGDTRHRQREPTENARPPEHTNHGSSRGERGTSRRAGTDHETKIRKTKAPPTPPNPEKSRPNPKKSRPNRKKEAPQKHPKDTPTRSEGHARGGSPTKTHPAPTAPPTKRSSTPHQGKQHTPPRGTAHTPKRRSTRPTDGEKRNTPPIYEIARPPRHKMNAKTKDRAGEAAGRRRLGLGAVLGSSRGKATRPPAANAPLWLGREPTKFPWGFCKEACVTGPGMRA